MSEKIEPALTPEEWENPSAVGYFDWPMGIVDISTEDDKTLPAKVIALANAALPDSDPRKITREMVADIRDLADFRRRVFLDDRLGDEKEAADSVEREMRFAAALESYLPPEPT